MPDRAATASVAGSCHFAEPESMKIFSHQGTKAPRSGWARQHLHLKHIGMIYGDCSGSGITPSCLSAFVRKPIQPSGRHRSMAEICDLEAPESEKIFSHNGTNNTSRVSKTRAAEVAAAVGFFSRGACKVRGGNITTKGAKFAKRTGSRLGSQSQERNVCAHPGDAAFLQENQYFAVTRPIMQ